MGDKLLCVTLPTKVKVSVITRLLLDLRTASVHVVHTERQELRLSVRSEFIRVNAGQNPEHVCMEMSQYM